MLALTSAAAPRFSLAHSLRSGTATSQSYSLSTNLFASGQGLLLTKAAPTATEKTTGELLVWRSECATLGPSHSSLKICWPSENVPAHNFILFNANPANAHVLDGQHSGGASVQPHPRLVNGPVERMPGHNCISITPKVTCHLQNAWIS